MSKAMHWCTVSPSIIIDEAMYLVKTNGAEWGDPDMRLLPGYTVKALLAPNIVRGTALYIAKITDPMEAS